MKKTSGNSHSFEILKKAIENNRPFHGVLFYGESGAGKKYSADLYAAMLQCTAPKEQRPCLKCKACKTVMGHVHPDVFYAKKTGKLGAISAGNASDAEEGTIRWLRSRFFEYPDSGRCRILIIPDCKDVGSWVQAQNMLLKVLEEPPEYGYIIFTASDQDIFLETILSRIIRLEIKTGTEAETVEILREKGYDGNSIQEAVKIAGGNFGDAVNFLSDEKEKEKINSMHAFLRAVADHDEYLMLKELQIFSKDRMEALEFAEKFRNLLCRISLEKVKNSNVNISGKFSYDELVGIYDKTKTLERSLKANLRPEFALTAFCADIAEL